MARHRIGLMIGTMNTDYPRAIRLGVENTLEAADAVLVNIADLIPYHTHAKTAMYLRVAFELVSRLNLDVTIVPLGTINGYLEGNEDLAREMLSSVDPSRLLVIERDLPGMRCLTKDGRPGMHAVMRHLIEDRHFTRIAFVSGPPTSVGAREREGVYFEEMAAHGLPVEDGMFVRGKFSGECPEVFESILERHPDVEAICCATDLLAFTAYRVLRQHGIAVGTDVAVTGFDDHPSASHIDPPLTTVHMTGYDFGCMAAREALRMCQGLPQEEFVLSSSLAVRASCGEDRTATVERALELVRRDPFPVREVAELVCDASLDMVTSSTRAAYRAIVEDVIEHVLGNYRRHLANPSSEDQLFSANDFSRLRPAELSRSISLEGLHATAVSILEATMRLGSEEHAKWLMGQVSELNNHIVRTQSSLLEQSAIERDRREWRTFLVAEDALVSHSNPRVAYELILRNFANLGIAQVDLFMLSEPIPVTGQTRLSLSDDLLFIGSLKGRIACVEDEPPTVGLHTLLDTVIGHYGRAKVISIGAVMAANELMGVVVLDTGTLDDNGVLMAMLNMGLAAKNLQLLSIEREMNEILSQSNVRLMRQSRYDEMTGMLNRRGLNDEMARVLKGCDSGYVCFLYLDLDGLKYINDNLGHDVGDEAIKAAADVLRSALPDSALKGRMGGDEFVVFATVEGGDEARGLTEAIQERTRQINAGGTLPFTLSISCGMDLVPITADIADKLNDSMMRADMRMYAMKERHHGSRRFAESRRDAQGGDGGQG